MGLAGRATDSQAVKTRTGWASGDRGRSERIDRHAEDQRRGGHAVPRREGRERRRCDGTAKVFERKPEGVENAGGDTGTERV
jgi:hypothetical protein